MPSDALFLRERPEHVAKKSGMVVVAVDERHGAGDAAQQIGDERQVLHALRPYAGVVQPIQRVVEQVAGEDEEVGLEGGDALHGAGEEVGHGSAEALRMGRGAGQVVAEMEVGQVDDTHEMVTLRIGR